MNQPTAAEKEDSQAPGSNSKVRNIILVNNGAPSDLHSTGAENESFWPNNLLGKLQNGAEALVAETLQKPTIGSLYNFNAAICPEYDNKKDYYKEFWRIYLQNEIILIDMKDYVTDIKNLQEQIKKVEEHHRSLDVAKAQSLKEKGLEKKKNRRPASEIQKNHCCPYESCSKYYGSEVSLNLHIKLKHKGGNKTDREKLAISIVKAKISGEEPPELNLNLPPGFLELYQNQIQIDPLQKLPNSEQKAFPPVKTEPEVDDYRPHQRKTSEMNEKYQPLFNHNTKIEARGLAKKSL